MITIILLPASELRTFFLGLQPLQLQLAVVIKIKSNFSEGEKLLFVGMVVAGLQVAQDAPVTTGLYVVQPLTVVSHVAVGARLHAF